MKGNDAQKVIEYLPLHGPGLWFQVCFLHLLYCGSELFKLFLMCRKLLFLLKVKGKTNY